MKEWRRVFSKVLSVEKKQRVWDSRKRRTGAEVFIESLGPYGKIFEDYISAKNRGSKRDLLRMEENIVELFKENPQWYSENKGGVKQYLKVFPGDFFLTEWLRILENSYKM